MYTIKNILVTTDFSEHSAAALDHALSMAEIHHATVHLLHVIEEHPGRAKRKGEAAAESWQNARETAAGRRMAKFIFEHVDEFTSVRGAIRQGTPHTEFIRYAKENEIDLIVIATHGRTGLAHVVMGSVAERTVRSSPIPVMTVKPAAVLERLVEEDDLAHDLHIPLS